MKFLLTALFFLIMEQAAESQTKPVLEIVKDSSITITLDKTHAVYLFQILQVAPKGFLDTEMPGYEIKKRIEYMDQLTIKLNTWLAEITPVVRKEADTTTHK